MTKYLNRIILGSALDVLREMPDISVDVCITSPPYYGLRSYKSTPQIWDGDPDCNHQWGKKYLPPGYRSNENRYTKGLASVAIQARDTWTKTEFCALCNAWQGELGHEPTYQLYIKHLIDIFREVKRVIKPTGAIWVNIADSYSGSGGAGGDYNVGGLKEGQPLYRQSQRSTVPAKSLIGIPERFAIAMTDELELIRRNTIIWHKPSCMPSSAKDRFTTDFEYFYFFVKQGKYYFEQQFEAYTRQLDRWGGDILEDRGNSKWSNGTGQPLYRNRNLRPNPLGRNMRTVWSINAEPSNEEHFAAFPTELVKTPILACCPEAICVKCNNPRERIYSKQYIEGKYSNRKVANINNVSPTSVFYTNNEVIRTFDRYSDCGCNAPFSPGVVMDIFAGTGTTCYVAKGLGRNYVGIEIQPKYVEIANEKLTDPLFVPTVTNHMPVGKEEEQQQLFSTVTI